MTSLMMISSVSICTATNQRRLDLISYKAFRKLARQPWLWMARQQNHPTDHLSVVALPPFFKPLGLTRLDASKFISLFFVTFWPYCLESWTMLWRIWYPWLTAGGVLPPTWFFLKVESRRFRAGFIRYIPITKDISALAYLVCVLRTLHICMDCEWFLLAFLGPFFLSLPTGLFAFLVLGFSLGMFQVPFLELFFGVFPIIMLASSLSYLRTPTSTSYHDSYQRHVVPSMT